MTMKPSLTTTVCVARGPQTVAEHVVLGLVTGGLLGVGLIIERREARSIAFTNPGEWLPTGPDRGEISLSENVPGETEVQYRLWCRGLARRRLLHAVVLGALVATITALVFGWLIHISTPVGIVVALVWDVVARFRQRSMLRRRVEAFMHNTNYLRTV